jgi:hypothetical protein
VALNFDKEKQKKLNISKFQDLGLKKEKTGQKNQDVFALL